MRKNDVWLGVGGLILKEGKILVVKKEYSKTKGLWTFPGGFVSANETIDEAIAREVKEETSIIAEVTGIIGMRTGVLQGGVSDNLVLFLMKYLSGTVKPRQGEIKEARFLTPEEIYKDKNSTEFLIESLEKYFKNGNQLEKKEFMPYRDYGYLTYRVFN